MGPKWDIGWREWSVHLAQDRDWWRVLVTRWWTFGFWGHEVSYPRTYLQGIKKDTKKCMIAGPWAEVWKQDLPKMNINGNHSDVSFGLRTQL
jgi:hypothetical protein